MPSKSLIQNLVPFIGMVVILVLFFLRYSDLRTFALLVGGFLIGLAIEKVGLFFSEYTKHSKKIVSTQTVQDLGQSLLHPGQIDQTHNSYLTGLLLAAYIPFAIFLVTSGGSWIGLGISLGWGWWYCTQFWKYRLRLQILEKKYWDSLPIQFNQLTFKNALVIFLIFYGLVVLFGLR